MFGICVLGYVCLLMCLHMYVEVYTYMSQLRTFDQHGLAPMMVEWEREFYRMPLFHSRLKVYMGGQGFYVLGYGICV